MSICGNNKVKINWGWGCCLLKTMEWLICDVTKSDYTPFKKKKKKNVRLHGQDFGTKVGLLAAKYINIFLCHTSPKIWKICPKKEEREFFIGPDSPSSSKFTGAQKV